SDFGSPLSPNGITCRVASQFPGLAIRRMDTDDATLGVCPLPLRGTLGVTNCPPISGAAASGCGNREVVILPQSHLDSSAPNRFGSARLVLDAWSQALIRSE